MLIPNFQSRRSWLTGLLLLVIVLNLYFNFAYEGSLRERRDWIDQFFARVILPFQFVVSSGQEGAQELGGSLTKLLYALEANKNLQSKINRMSLDLQKLEELALENSRLRDLLRFRQARELNYLAAEVIGREPNPFHQGLLIDRGSRDGITVGMPVLSMAGVVGRIVHVGLWTSQVLLISDINSRLDGVVQRSRTRVIVAGSGDGSRLNLRFLPRRQDIQVGDVVMTSGLGQNFPAGFIVGKVKNIKKDPNDVLEIGELEPAVDFSSVEELFIVLDVVVDHEHPLSKDLDHEG